MSTLNPVGKSPPANPYIGQIWTDADLVNWQWQACTNRQHTILSSDISATATTIVVDSCLDFPSVGIYTVVINTERLLVTAGQGTLIWTVVRGYDGSRVGIHVAGTTVALQVMDWISIGTARPDTTSSGCNIVPNSPADGQIWVDANGVRWR